MSWRLTPTKTPIPGKLPASRRTSLPLTRTASAENAREAALEAQRVVTSSERCACIFKVYDDCRQDSLVIQVPSCFSLFSFLSLPFSLSFVLFSQSLFSFSLSFFLFSLSFYLPTYLLHSYTLTLLHSYTFTLLLYHFQWGFVLDLHLLSE